MTETIDLLGIGNAMTGNLYRSSDDALKKNGPIQGSMALIDGQKAAHLAIVRGEKRSVAVVHNEV